MKCIRILLYNRIQCVIQFNLSNSLIFEINFVLPSFIHPLFLFFYLFLFSSIPYHILQQSATFFTFSITIIDVVVNLVIVFILLLPVLLNTSRYIFFYTYIHTYTHTSISSSNVCWIKSYHIWVNRVNRATKYQNLFALHFWVSIRKGDEEEEKYHLLYFALERNRHFLFFI